jgi:hypothetical protein
MYTGVLNYETIKTRIKFFSVYYTQEFGTKQSHYAMAELYVFRPNFGIMGVLGLGLLHKANTVSCNIESLPRCLNSKGQNVQ